MPSKLSVLLGLALAAAAAPGENDFHIFSGTDTLAEGGSTEKLMVVTGNLQFAVHPPRDWFHHMDEAGRKIVFTDPSGRSALTIQFTANSPGALPALDVLQTQVRQAHPGADILQHAVCPTSYKPGVFFDLVRVPAPNLVQKIRHAFISEPAGEVEFVLSASDDEFARGKLIFMGLLQSFQVEPAKPKQP